MVKKSYPPERYVDFSPPSPVVLLTCCSRDSGANIITVGMYMPISFKPPLIVVGVSPRRYSHGLIKETGEFVVNVPSRNIIDKAVYCGTRSGRDVDKFKETGLTPIKARYVKPPIIKECKVHIECRVYGSHDVGDHTLFVGRVLTVSVDEGLEREDLLDVLKAQPIAHRGPYYFTHSLTHKVAEGSE